MKSNGGRELIHCNGDGGADAECTTYTICRTKVPRPRLVEEIDEGLHPAFYARNYAGGWFAVKRPDARHINNINKTRKRWVCAAQTDSRRTDEGPLSSFVKMKNGGSARMVELIHGERGGPHGRNESYTLCRLGVTRQRVVAEIRAGMHPAYHVEVVDGVEYPRPDNSETTATRECPLVCHQP